MMKRGEAIALVFLVVIGGAAVFLALKAKGAAPAPQKVGFQATVGSITNSLPAPVRNVVQTTTAVTRTGFEKVGDVTHTGKTGEWAARIATFPVLGPLSLF